MKRRCSTFLAAFLTMVFVPLAHTVKAQQDCVLTGQPIVLVDTGLDLNFPVLAFDGTDYGITFTEWDWPSPVTVQFVLLDSGGAVAAGPTVVSDPAFSADIPSQTFGGTQYAACWQDLRDEPNPDADPKNWEVYANLIDTSGSPVGSGIRISNALDWSEEPAIAYNPVDQEFAVVWDDLRFSSVGLSEIYFRRMNAVGTVLDPEVTVSTGWTSSIAPDIAWDGSGFGIVWIDDRNSTEELFFHRVTEDGSSFTGDIAVSEAHLYIGPSVPAELSAPSICWSGFSFGIAWVDDRTGNDEIYFIQLNQDGSVALPEMQVTNDVSLTSVPEITWNGGTFLIAYTDERFGATSIMMSAISPAGIELVDDARLLDVNGAVIQLSLAWSGTDLALAWDDDEQGHFQLHLAFVDCSVPTPVVYSSYEARPKDPGIEVTWSTLSEIETFGFQVLSAASHDLPASAVSPIIPAVRPGFPYTYQHTSGDPTLYYKIWEITASGAGTETPLFPVTTTHGNLMPQHTVWAGEQAADTDLPPAAMEAQALLQRNSVVLTWSPPPALEIEAYRVWMRHFDGRKPLPIGTLIQPDPGQPMSFEDSSGPALVGARGEYKVVALHEHNVVAVSDWIPNPALKRDGSTSVKRSRGGEEAAAGSRSFARQRSIK